MYNDYTLNTENSLMKIHLAESRNIMYSVQRTGQFDSHSLGFNYYIVDVMGNRLDRVQDYGEALDIRRYGSLPTNVNMARQRKHPWRQLA